MLSISLSFAIRDSAVAWCIIWHFDKSISLSSAPGPSFTCSTQSGLKQENLLVRAHLRPGGPLACPAPAGRKTSRGDSSLSLSHSQTGAGLTEVCAGIFTRIVEVRTLSISNNVGSVVHRSFQQSVAWTESDMALLSGQGLHCRHQN